MRILQVINAPLDSTGRSQHIQCLSDGLRAVGHEVMVVSQAGTAQDIVSDHGIETRTLKVTSSFRLWREIQHHAREWGSQVLHAHNPDAIRLCLMTRLPVVATDHGDPLEFYRRGRLNRSLSHLIVSSEVARSRLLACRVFQSDQIPVIPECLSFDEYVRHLDKQSDRPRHQNRTQEPVLLYVPFSDQRHELTNVFESSRLVSQRGLPHRLLVLSAPHEFRSALAQQKLINREVGYPLIEVLEGGDLYPGILAQVDIVLGMGRTVLEALASDRPVICLQSGELGGIVSAAHAFGWEYNRFESDEIRSAQDIADDIGKVLKNRSAFARSFGQVRTLMSQVVDARNVATRTTAVYRTCIELHRRMRGWRHTFRCLRFMWG